MEELFIEMWIYKEELNIPYDRELKFEMEELGMDLTKLMTESRNNSSGEIDMLSTFEMLKVINSEDKKIAKCIELILPEVTKAVDFISDAFQNSGRLIYIGAGTSGRLGI